MIRAIIVPQGPKSVSFTTKSDYYNFISAFHMQNINEEQKKLLEQVKRYPRVKTIKIRGMLLRGRVEGQLI